MLFPNDGCCVRTVGHGAVDPIALHPGGKAGRAVQCAAKATPSIPDKAADASLIETESPDATAVSALDLHITLLNFSHAGDFQGSLVFLHQYARHSIAAMMRQIANGIATKTHAAL